jgi:DNA-binding CsgD family transcriptional regulator
LRALPQDVRSSIGMALIVAADLELNSGHPAGARPLLAEALAIWQELADEQHVAVALWRLGRVERLVGHPHEAGEFLTQALGSLRNTFDRNLEYMALADLGLTRLAAGRYDEAMAAFTTSLEIARELKVSDGTVAGTLEGLARLRMQLGHVDEGVRLFGAADRLRQRTTTPVPRVERDQYRRDLKAARQKLRTSYESQWTIGQTLSFEQAVALALSPVAVAARMPRRPAVAAARPVAGLTEREHEVLCDLVKGKTDREIGESLGIKVSTARTLVQRVREKLAVNSRNAAAAMAVEAGWCIETG